MNKVKELGLLNETVIHGTLRTDNLIEAFMSLLQDLDPEEYRKAIDDQEEFEDRLSNDDDALQEERDLFLHEYLFDKLNEYAPKGYYFGSHPGDGSDFGFWEVEDEEY